MAEDTVTLILEPAKHDKLGIIHCGVTREGLIQFIVGGDPRNIEDGEEIVFERVGIKAKRSGSTYTFDRV